MVSSREARRRMDDVFDETDDRVYDYFGIANPRSSLTLEGYDPDVENNAEKKEVIGEVDYEELSNELKALKTRRPYNSDAEI